jgi:ATP-dependent DNA ligase
VANHAAATRAEALALADGFLAEGYEGAIARFPAGGYEYGTSNYHSDALVKLKPVLRDEFPVIGYLGGRRGKDVGAVIWVASVGAGAKKFNVVPKDMSYADRYAIFAALEADPGSDAGPGLFERDFAGLLLTVEYADRTKAGVPAQAKAVGFRGVGPAGEPVDLVDDPVAKILAAAE